MNGTRPELLQCGAIARHRHAAPYIAVVLSGGYEEAGDTGRFLVSAGDVLVHGDFSAHCNLVGPARARVLNLAVAARAPFTPRGRINDPDLIARIAERDRQAASTAVAAMFEPVNDCEIDEVDALAAHLCGNGAERIGLWAETRGRARETISRRFREKYGVDAARFRIEVRARRAWRMIVRTGMPLAEIASASGHADQPHMTRAVKALTGRTPGAWRRITSVQDGI